MGQATLFDTDDPGTGAYGQPALAAARDPATSHEAAERVRPNVDDQAHRVAALVRLHPGCTGLELASRSDDPGLDRYVIGRRLSVAEGKGLVRRGEPRECRQSGFRALTWFPVERGQG
jgi:hypothetical protein